jgi:AcrR family transcriptional regulator
MGQSGFHGMSIQTLADTADVSVGLIYQYFGGKEDVLEAVIVDILSSYQAKVPAAIDGASADPVEKLAAGFVAYCQVVETHRDATVLAYRESKTLGSAGRERIKALELGTIEPLRQVIHEGQKAGIFVDSDPDLIAHDLMMFAHAWALKHWHLSTWLTLTEYVRQQFAVVVRSIVPGEAWRKYKRNISVWINQVEEVPDPSRHTA